MKVTVDRKRCEGYGFCEERAPNLLRLNDKGELEIPTDDIPDTELDKARLAVRSCPVAALKLDGA